MIRTRTHRLLAPIVGMAIVVAVAFLLAGHALHAKTSKAADAAIADRVQQSAPPGDFQAEHTCPTYCEERDDTPRAAAATLDLATAAYTLDPLHTGQAEPFVLSERVPTGTHISPLDPPPVLLPAVS